jgi:hypothetical protein
MQNLPNSGNGTASDTKGIFGTAVSSEPCIGRGTIGPQGRWVEKYPLQGAETAWIQKRSFLQINVLISAMCKPGRGGASKNQIEGSGNRAGTRTRNSADFRKRLETNGRTQAWRPTRQPERSSAWSI